MNLGREIWAIVPVKGLAGAKQRLAGALSPELRRRLALAMVEDVLTALARVPHFGGIAVVTIDPIVTQLANRLGARVLTEGALDGHTGAVRGAAGILAREGREGFITMPGDIPLVTPEEIGQVLAVHDRGRAFTIVPAHDGRGSNAIVCTPCDLVPLQFGDDSFLPHLQAAEERGVRPKIVRVSGIGLDIDRPEDLVAFLRVPSRTRAAALLEQAQVELQRLAPGAA